ncbi:hypothetical protein CN620_08955 [Bacillus pseudomycoides]|uniref:hypothetical protein n=1 Tax=Bacillus pseudomycoides TaxID=64104 RepID=UPI000BF033DD|nr:hypothetical protein [Bacillus pseudomycoides]PEI42622.1 hypothetical protein CN620_08955 [Bacillus pseudomycoides]
MEEVKRPMNRLDIEVNVDTDEAQGRIERLTQATEKCTKAFEELGDAIANIGALLNGNQSEADQIEITTFLDGKVKASDVIQRINAAEEKIYI